MGFVFYVKLYMIFAIPFNSLHGLAGDTFLLYVTSIDCRSDALPIPFVSQLHGHFTRLARP
jgi:hypothetical protein